jgi:hypothetical protein
MESTMGHVIGGYNNMPFHLPKRLPFSKEEMLDARGMSEPIYNGALRTRNLVFKKPSGTSEMAELLKSGTLQNL